MADAFSLPFLTAYDPPGTSEGTLDPLGLYQIADQLAVQLVPAVRERMQRIRFLTAMAVGALVTEGLEDDGSQRDASPYLIWEWLVVEALVREPGGADSWGVAGSLVAKRARDVHGHLDARSYLKTPRIFGFHGVYKRLAIRLGIVDVHLAIGPNTEMLVDAWARGLKLAGLAEARPMLARWAAGVRRSAAERPPRTRPGWNGDGWRELAQAFAPTPVPARERRCLHSLLHSADERRLGALSSIWELQDGFPDDTFAEETLHDRLGKREPSYRPLLSAIRTYEAFARALQDAFDVLKFEAAVRDARGFAVTDIAESDGFKRSVKELPRQFEEAHNALNAVTAHPVSLASLFAERFRSFAEPLDWGACALALCAHHEAIQKAKSADGKRPWFDRVAQDRIYIRHAYRDPRREIVPGHYVHDYRGKPIRRFHHDLQ